MSAQTKNYMEGPDKWVINGALAFGTGATVTGLAADPLLPATDEQLGGVIVGDGLEVTENGVLSAAAATADTLGGVKVGEGLAINENGVLSVAPVADAYPVTFSTEGASVVCDKTYDEVAAAINAGKYVYGVWVPSAQAPKIFLPGLQFIEASNLMYFWQVADPSYVLTKISYHKVNGVVVTTLNTDRYYPTAPTEDGTYVLKCVKNGSAVTRSWVKEE